MDLEDLDDLQDKFQTYNRLVLQENPNLQKEEIVDNFLKWIGIDPNIPITYGKRSTLAFTNLQIRIKQFMIDFFDFEVRMNFMGISRSKDDITTERNFIVCTIGNDQSIFKKSKPPHTVTEIDLVDVFNRSDIHKHIRGRFKEDYFRKVFSFRFKLTIGSDKPILLKNLPKGCRQLILLPSRIPILMNFDFYPTECRALEMRNVVGLGPFELTDAQKQFYMNLEEVTIGAGRYYYARLQAVNNRQILVNQEILSKLRNIKRLIIRCDIGTKIDFDNMKNLVELKIFGSGLRVETKIDDLENLKILNVFCKELDSDQILTIENCPSLQIVWCIRVDKVSFFETPALNMVKLFNNTNVYGLKYNTSLKNLTIDGIDRVNFKEIVEICNTLNSLDRLFIFGNIYRVERRNVVIKIPSLRSCSISVKIKDIDFQDMENLVDLKISFASGKINVVNCPKLLSLEIIDPLNTAELTIKECPVIEVVKLKSVKTVRVFQGDKFASSILTENQTKTPPFYLRKLDIDTSFNQDSYYSFCSQIWKVDDLILRYTYRDTIKISHYIVNNSMKVFGVRNELILQKMDTIPKLYILKGIDVKLDDTTIGEVVNKIYG